MKIASPILALIFVGLLVGSCNNQTKKNTSSVAEVSGEIQVIYFHNTKRCATCNAVEDETKIALELYYKDQLSEDEISFTSLNLEEEDGKKMAETLHVSGQTLLLIYGENQVNLTSDGFMYARTNPSKFHEILKIQIDKLL
jgi:hypothetical protein